MDKPAKLVKKIEILNLIRDTKLKPTGVQICRLHHKDYEMTHDDTFVYVLGKSVSGIFDGFECIIPISNVASITYLK